MKSNPSTLGDQAPQDTRIPEELGILGVLSGRKYHMIASSLRSENTRLSGIFTNILGETQKLCKDLAQVASGIKVGNITFSSQVTTLQHIQESIKEVSQGFHSVADSVSGPLSQIETVYRQLKDSKEEVSSVTQMVI